MKAESGRLLALRINRRGKFELRAEPTYLFDREDRRLVRRVSQHRQWLGRRDGLNCRHDRLDDIENELRHRVIKPHAQSQLSGDLLWLEHG